MACTINVTSVTINGGNVIITGTYNNSPPCTGAFQIAVTVNCDDTNGNPISCTGVGNPLPGSILWQATVPCNCACPSSNLTITVNADCLSPAWSCTFGPASFNACCCPSATTAISLGSCSSGTQLVTFNTNISIPDTCTYNLRRDFGDGNFGAVNTFTGPGTFVYPQEQHNYVAPGTYTANLDAIPTPYGCGTIDSVNVTVACGACNLSVLVAAFCRFFALLYLVSIVTGFVLAIALPCTSIFVALGFIAVGIVALIIYMLLNCQSCTCGFMQKFTGEILFATGIVLLMFTVTSCAAIPTFIALAIGIAFMGIGFNTLQAWYNNNKVTCPLTICDFWCALAGMMNLTSATNVAINAAVLVWISSGFVPSIGLGIALGVASFIAIIVAIFPLSQTPCHPNTPTCQ